MIGVKLTKRSDGAAWEITGANGGGWVVSPCDFGSPVGPLPLAALADEFETTQELTVPEPVDEQRGWDALAAANLANADAQLREVAPSGLSPEQQFARLAEDSKPKRKRVTA